MSFDSMMAGCVIKNARIVIAVCSGRLAHGGRAGEAGRDGVVQAGGEGVGLGAGRSAEHKTRDVESWRIRCICSQRGLAAGTLTD